MRETREFGWGVYMEKKDDLVHSVRNALKILRLFSLENPERGVTEISRELGLSTSTVHRLMTTLQKAGYLEGCEGSRRYQLGYALLGLGEIVTYHFRLDREVQPILERLVESVDEAVHVGILEEDKVVILQKLECKHPVRLQSAIGKGLPAFCSGTGRAILAFQSKKVIDRVLECDMPTFTPTTLSDPAHLRVYLEEIRRVGYALSIDELHNDVVCISVPVRDYTGEVIASVSIAGPRERMPKEKFPFFIKTLSLAGEGLSEQLGYVRVGDSNGRG